MPPPMFRLYSFAVAEAVQAAPFHLVCAVHNRSACGSELPSRATFHFNPVSNAHKWLSRTSSSPPPRNTWTGIAVAASFWGADGHCGG